MQTGGGAGGRPGVGPPGRASATSSPSPSSSSSAVSTQRLRFDSIQQQQQPKQSLQQQLLRKPDGNETFLGYQAGGAHGVMGFGNYASPSGPMSQPQQSRINQQHVSPNMRDDTHNRNQGAEQSMMHPVHQAYYQYAVQANQQKSAMGMQVQQAKMSMAGTPSGKDQDVRLGNSKMHEMISMQSSNQSSVKQFHEHLIKDERLVDQGHQPTSDQNPESKHSAQSGTVGQLMHSNMVRPPQTPQTSQIVQSMANNPAVAAQLQAMQAWAHEHNIDITNHANANLMSQLLPIMQSRLVAQQKANENNSSSQSSPTAMSRQPVVSPPAMSEHSRGNDVPGQASSGKSRHTSSTSSFGTVAGIANSMIMQQFPIHNRDTPLAHHQSAVSGTGVLSMQPPQSSVTTSQGVATSLQGNNASSGPETQPTQYLRQLNRASSELGSSATGGSGNVLAAQAGVANQSPQQFYGFTKQQLHVLKAQILAFRRLKKGDVTLPQELLRAIAPPPLEAQLQQTFSGTSNSDRSVGKAAEDYSKTNEPNEKHSQTGTLPNEPGNSKEAFTMDEKAMASIVNNSHSTATTLNKADVLVAGATDEHQNIHFPVKPEPEAERGTPKAVIQNNLSIDRGKAVVLPVATPDQVKKPVQGTTTPQAKDANSTRKYHGPLFDFPFFTRKHDSSGSSTAAINNNNLLLAYDLKDLLHDEGVEVLSRRRAENLKKIGDLLAINLERKRIRPDLVLRLQIEEKKLRLLDLQARLRDEVDLEQQDIMTMPDRPYRKFVRLCERQRMELARQVQSSKKALREKQLKSIFQWRKRLLEAHWAIRDARTARNRGVAKYHERMLREFSKRKDDDRNKRMEALKNNDVERYRQMLMEQQSSIPGEAAERYAVLSSFLSQTEEYLQKLGSKITAAKNQQEGDEAANVASAAARAQGLSEEEVRAAAACAREEVMIRNRFSEMNAPRENSSVNKYYSLAHAVNERVTRQPSMLRAGTLRDYQLVGLQWMLSLYNNKLNGILADEMGLGKTVQVMALIAHLMEFKGNYGPHLIIVPNAVLVNWKSEFHNWLPSVSCIFYVGTKDTRAKLFSQEVCAMKFNVLVTTYEFIMYDRSKLSKVDWKYIIIDEAQRMKDRESVLARDLDRYRCQRRLLLTGTPLQNDLKELWSLLNLLLPEVFDNRRAFHDWFSKPFQKEGPTHTAEDDWLETEKKVIIIHRLHQILEPFMLRRRVEDVEGSLPPKVSIVLRCKMSAMQSAIYDWIKTTGTLRVDPEDEQRRVQRSSVYQAKTYKTLNNRCMELRKTCNHPLLNYPYFNDFSKDFLVKSCGKLWILDRILIKLQRTGHRVLLFSTMTKLLDILEEYLQWRRLLYRRIDGTTSLEDRESAIVDFNSPGSDCFIFLLSIRAAGRGLNLQTADTVVIYDPDPNPKNEEQAVARAHRIGQKREVKVIYMEAVVDKLSSHQKEDEYRNGGTVDYEDDLAGKDRYMGSIESLIRNNIQQYKIDMADEVINAGRFDQRTTHEERRTTLEALLHDEERYQETVHDVPSLQEVNRMIARSEEEVELFDQMDEELDWAEEMTRYEQVPMWLRASSREVNATVANLSKKPAKNAVFVGNILDSNEIASDSSPKNGRKRGRPKGKMIPNYSELDDEENVEYSDASSDERNVDSAQEEEVEVAELEDEDTDHAVGAASPNKYQTEDDPASNVNYQYLRGSDRILNNHIVEEAGSSGSSSDSQRPTQMMSPSISSQKFSFLSALDARPGSLSKKTSDDLEEGEIAASGESHMDRQQSGSWIHDREDGEDEQVLQPKIKRKRSLRLRPRQIMKKPEEKIIPGKPSLRRGDPFHLPFPVDSKCDLRSRPDPESKPAVDAGVYRPDSEDSSLKYRHSLPSRRNTSKLRTSPKSGRSNGRSSSAEEAEHSRDSWERKTNTSGAMQGPRMSDVIQRRCKNVISKLQRRIDREGQQIVPLLTDLWKKIEKHGYKSASGIELLDLRRIDQRIDRLEYSGVMELVASVQYMLKGAMQFYGCSLEVRTEARKVHDLFFDILKIAFPDTDFREARNAISFSGQGAASTSTASARLLPTSQSKRHKLINEVESDRNGLSKPLSRSSMPAEDTRTRSQMVLKESRLVSQQEEPRLLTHPGELVICKKKRKDREKSLMKPRTVSSGPVSPPPIRSPILCGAPRDSRSAQQTSHHQGWSGQSAQQSNGGSVGGGNVGWANPVKRMRTDTGKRRPSHL
uniref:ATP-dependent helicase BRM n=1 Tax=Kalanchoe fedtschenkoi TaxID=63787 RepID=A0A7N0UTQ1_KALFE